MLILLVCAWNALTLIYILRESATGSWITVLDMIMRVIVPHARSGIMRQEEHVRKLPLIVSKPQVKVLAADADQDSSVYQVSVSER